MNPMKIGQVAKRTGLTVRALHHYDHIGLLSPKRRTSSAHRLYGPEELARLQQIVTLRQLGFGLDDIGRMLDVDGLSLLQVIEQHIAHLEQRIERERHVIDRLHKLAHRLSSGATPDADETLKTIEALIMFEKYYSPDQLMQLEKRAQDVGEERMREVQAEWQELFSRARELQSQGADPASPEVRELLAWQERLIDEFTGGDKGVRQSLARMYREEPNAGDQFGIDGEAMRFLAQASAAADGETSPG